MDTLPHSASKLDLYSVPVFLVEAIVLVGLAISAHYLHFQHKYTPTLTGFYCDDVSLRHTYRESQITKPFTRPDEEFVMLSLLLGLPIVMIVFCELVNSMFGSLKFRKIRALCKCCKLHSITRRTIRFSGAYLLGFLIVMISCDILANATGRLKPYFAQECPNAFRDCALQVGPNTNQLNQQVAPPRPGPTGSPAEFLPANSGGGGPSSAGDAASLVPDANLRPLSPPIINPPTGGPVPQANRLTRTRRDTLAGAAGNTVDRRLLERQWILLEGVNLARLCDFSGDEIQTRKFAQLAMSWPSFPAAIFTYACLFLACYLCFVGTARPVRIITSVLVMILLLAAAIFNMGLVREHFSHWEDALSGALLAGVVVLFVLLVYLNKFKDAHFYENQKLSPFKRSAGSRQFPGEGGQNTSNGYSNEIALEQYSLDKGDDDDDGGGPGPTRTSVGGGPSGGDNGGSMPNNDLAMRYFQIPRANYRGAPRPLSSSTNNHM